MISVEEFLAVLKEKDLVPDALILKLYNQAAHHITAAEIAQKLIDEGYLTPVLVNRLMGVEIEQSSRFTSGVEEQKKSEEDIGFAPIKEETEPRPMLGKHRSYKTGDSSKSSASSKSPSIPPKPPEPPPPKSLLVNKPPPSPWATSMYDREIDSSKGIVSPRLVQMAGVEQTPTTLITRKPNRWLKLLIRGGIALGVAILVYELICLIISQFSK
jgi:hypothetical protein